METVEINGVKYVPTQAVGDIRIIVLEGGFVYVGRYHVREQITIEGDDVRITNARAVIRWGTSAHLGQLSGGPLSNTRLGAKCIVMASLSQILHTIAVSQDAWTKHID